jgi:hypothetical protein
MKKIAILAVIILVSFSIQAQRVFTWKDSVNVGGMVAADTIMQPTMSNNVTVGGCVWSMEVDAERMVSLNAKFEIGGGNSYMRKSNVYYKFSPFITDSIPKTLNRTAMSKVERNGGITDTVYVFCWYDYVFPFEMPMVRITKNSSTGWVKWTAKFWR